MKYENRKRKKWDFDIGKTNLILQWNTEIQERRNLCLVELNKIVFFWAMASEISRDRSVFIQPLVTLFLRYNYLLYPINNITLFAFFTGGLFNIILIMSVY